jgi:hypothetical protein
MAREYSNDGYKVRSILERGIRASVRRGELTRGDVKVLNIRRAARGMSQISLDGIEDPTPAVRAAAVRATAAAKKKRPYVSPVTEADAKRHGSCRQAGTPVKAKPKASITPAAMAAARKKVAAAIAAGVAKAKRK